MQRPIGNCCHGGTFGDVDQSDYKGRNQADFFEGVQSADIAAAEFADILTGFQACEDISSGYRADEIADDENDECC